ncbi:hypothetical protein H9P43_001836 [Blastocladiella emersonii ATCC 22665]|nr:hypothetical protein H9P43_001836 [Blastocladiella emersonii ATCC 22665]
MRPTEKNCLVARSKCFLQLGDADQALQDAETALKEDAEFFKGMYQKAEALYAKGDFEMALVFYHRGNKLRPELDEFRLGIQKAREAIDNSIGDPRDYKFKAPASQATDTNKRQMSPPQARSSQQKKSAKGDKGAGGVVVSTLNNTRKIIPRGESAAPVPPQRDVKQLLGELHEDKQYLEQLLNDRDFVNNPNDRIFDLVSDALKYLETRTEFWRQQKPIYARRKEAQTIRTKMASARSRQQAREKDRAAAAAAAATGGESSPGSPTKSSSTRSPSTDPNAPPKRKVLSPRELFVAIDRAIAAANHKRVINLGRDFLSAKLENVEDRDQLRAHVLSVMGTAAMELGNYPEAEKRYLQALSSSGITPEVQSMTLGHLGRAYAKQRKFSEAAAYWERKLGFEYPLSPVEKAWLYHDIARCYLELGRDDQARAMAEKSCAFAVESAEPRWLLNSHVLEGQVFAKVDPAKARGGYETALKYAETLHEDGAVSVIQQALQGLAVA